MDALLSHAVLRVTEAMDTARLDEGPAAEALLRLLDLSWQSLLHHLAVLEVVTSALPQELREQHHQPIADQLGTLVRRGQIAGEFRSDVPPAWLVATYFALVHTGGHEAVAGRLPSDDALDVLASTVLAAFTTKP